MADALDRAIFTRNIHRAQIRAELLRPAQLVTFYLMASYLYYQCDISLMADSEYDKICKRLLAEWDSIEHVHKKVIDYDSLGATTGFTLRLHDYPLITQSAALRYAQERGLL
jgi:NAD-dependent DNA ligase